MRVLWLAGLGLECQRQLVSLWGYDVVPLRMVVVVEDLAWDANCAGYVYMCMGVG